MGLKKKLLGLGLSALIGLNSLFPINTKASDLENKVGDTGLISERLSNIPYISNLARTYSNWYLADFLMVTVHEQGHYDEMNRLGLNPSIYFDFTLYFVGGNVSSEFEGKSKEDKSRVDIAGFKNAGILAEYLKQEILMGNISGKELKFKSMLALACELNLPFYLGQNYFKTVPDNDFNDIENFTKNSGINPQTMAISSGLHILVNAPYIYNLTKNALSYNPEGIKPKPYFLSFRYDGDSYILYLHLDI